MLNKREKYLRILGLDENATSKEIRDCYHLLAKKFHPDKNHAPDAHNTFVNIQEAYSYLTKNKIKYWKNSYSKSNDTSIKEKDRLERIRLAKEKLRAYEQREAQKLDEKHKELTSGIKWSVFIFFAYATLVCALLLITDLFLPRVLSTEKITHVSAPIKGFDLTEVICIQTNKSTYYVSKDLRDFIIENHEVFIEKTRIFHTARSVYHYTKTNLTHYNTDYTLLNLNPILPILFLLPILIVKRKRLSILYIFAYNAVFYVVGIVFLIFICTGNRAIHILTIGIK